MRHFTVELNQERAVTLEAILFDAPSPDEQPTSLEHPRPAVIIAPGGGYMMLSQREADPVVAAFLRRGFNTLVLRYSLREHAAYPHPAIDAAQAVRWVRAHAHELGIDPAQVTLLGFSAGGHVTALLGTHWHRDDLLAAERAEYETAGRLELLDFSSRPDYLVTSYGAFSVEWADGDDAIHRTAAAVDCIAAVTDKTPPAFVWTTGEDEVVPPSQSLRFVTALAQAGVPFEYHHFQRGAHGLSTADELSSADRESLPENVAAWVDLAANWLRANGAA
ncbi:MAG: alpha/beta hydrolase [Propionibacteriaceae bacterium]|nr:alpha/beta hydrolase [Propionibacteriaceae bacterium]